MESLRPLGVEYDVLFINGRGSRWSYLRAVGEMRRRLCARRYDLVHAHFGLSGWVARWQGRVPVVVSFMGDDVLGQLRRDGSITPLGRFYQASSWVLARLVSSVIVKSGEMRSKLGLGSAHVIPNGVDLELFRPMERAEARRRLGLDPSKKFVLFPFDAALENKRFDLIEAAVARARQEIPQLEILKVCGVPRAQMPLYLNAADLLVLASHSEGSSNVIKEALAVNLPVVSVEVGDAAELIGPVEGCHLVPRQVEPIAARIVDVCRLGSRSRGRESVTRLSMENAAQRIVEVYATAARR
jgi:glycosyltransferase involved in cell wall biosynthesis